MPPPHRPPIQELHTEFSARGLTIMAFPCNQFGGQEPGTAESIATFCKTTYGVTFPLLEKQAVNGPERSALYQQLVGGGDDVEQQQADSNSFLMPQLGLSIQLNI